MSSDATPLVLVQGFLGFAEIGSWDRHINTFNRHGLGSRQVLLPSVGPISSLHDRACELYYTLAGGTVDYGIEHSERHHHARYGRSYSIGLYPKWSTQHPLHFLGYSIGGPTIVKLQHLLREGHFGKEGHPDMVLSLNAVCSPFRGTQLVYVLGEDVAAAPNVRPLSLGSLLTKVIHVAAYLSPLLPAIFDLHAEARFLSYRNCSLRMLGKHLWKSDWAESKDAVPFDMTFEAADHRDMYLEGRAYPNTFYRSHVSRMTIHSPIEISHSTPPLRISSITHNILYLWSKSIGTFNYTSLEPPPSFLIEQPATRSQNTRSWKLVPEGEEYFANDGVVPVFSQWHPLPCRSTTCEHYKMIRAQHLKGHPEFMELPNQLIPGCWHVLTVDESNHLSLIPKLFGKSSYQREFWTALERWLDAVDASVLSS